MLSLTPIALESGNQKNRKTISHTDTQMNCQRGWRHQPAIETGAGNGAFFI